MTTGKKGSGDVGSGDRGESIKPEQEQGYTDAHGQGPQAGQGHQGSSARLSDHGSQGPHQKGTRQQETGSHGGARREHSNPGPDSKHGDET